MADVPTPKDVATKAPTIPAFDLLEIPGYRSGWTICCDFCPNTRDFYYQTHTQSRQNAAGLGWTYTHDHFNACWPCSQAGVA